MSDTPEAEGASPAASAQPGIDPTQLAFVQSQLRSQQNVMLGVIGGAGAAALGAALWAGVTLVTGVQIGFMAIGIGYLVGLTVRAFGKGIDPVFGVVGAVLSLCGCVVGNLLAVTAMIATHQGVPFADAVSQLTPELAYELMRASFSPMDLIFYGLAVYEGYRVSFRRVSPEELQRMLTGSGPLIG